MTSEVTGEYLGVLRRTYISKLKGATLFPLLPVIKVGNRNESMA